MKVPNEELTRRFSHHPPKNKRIQEAHGMVRHECVKLADILNNMLVPGREKSVALTKLEEVMFWANSSIARNQEVMDIKEEG